MAILLTLSWAIVCPLIFYCIFLYLENKWREGRISKILNRYVLVAGCDSGFGNAIAKHLDKLGVKVFASCLTEKGINDLKANCSSRLLTLRLDVTNKEEISQAVQMVKGELPNEKDFWGIVNNAGLHILHAPIEIHNENHYQRTMAVNLYGPIYVTRAFLPLLRKSRGRVVTISSDCGFMTWPARSAYCISKYGVESFTDCIRREMYHVGITASTVLPGAFKTSIVTPEGMNAQLEDACSKVSKEVRDFYGEGFYAECRKHYQSIPPLQKPDLSPVVNAVEHALFSRHPKRRYLAGNDIKWWKYPISLLPVWILDWYIAMTPPDKAKE